MKRKAAAPKPRKTKKAKTVISKQPMPSPRFVGKTEVKSVDIVAAQYNLNSTGSILAINLIRAGTSFNNRVGRKIELKNLYLTGFIQPRQTAAQNSFSDIGRICILYDAQTNGALPALADVFQDVDQAGTGATNLLSNINLNYRDRFKILRDIRIQLPACNQNTGIITNDWPSYDGEEGNIKEFIKLKGLLTQYKADSSPAVIGDIATGGLYLVTFAGLAAGADNFTAYLGLRLRFWDQ